VKKHKVKLVVAMTCFLVFHSEQSKLQLVKSWSN